jgi:hypothetical protein
MARPRHRYTGRRLLHPVSFEGLEIETHPKGTKGRTTAIGKMTFAFLSERSIKNDMFLEMVSLCDLKDTVFMGFFRFREYAGDPVRLSCEKCGRWANTESRN